MTSYSYHVLSEMLEGDVCWEGTTKHTNSNYMAFLIYYFLMFLPQVPIKY